MTKADDFDLQDFLPYLLNQAADASSNGFQSYYKAKYGMLRTEWRVLFHLGRYGRMTAKEICARAGIHKTKVSRAVRALEQKRYLTRTEVPKDRRHEELQLTRQGQAAYGDLSLEAKRYDRALMSQVPAAQRDMLRACLRQIADMRNPDA
ncbi:MarR family winged helix-turn-helix transcriptional regulator [uncultured Sulfitobacter sp.]|uniref:MarR family winged helix-turn-helix transcriptional regulator n=1 Tax=uncultured Sulfitobacter sp. TaxID=191468 RepID=UPI002604B88F|nr:MarR family winged helix-turn-helix transcriptional regulator [uncultured Sulfitobacter sp.]